MVIVVLLALSIKIVREYERGVVFFLGRFQSVKGPGLIIILPVIQQFARVADALLYAGDRIRVNSVHPGFIWTPMVEKHLQTLPDPQAAKKATAEAHPPGERQSEVHHRRRGGGRRGLHLPLKRERSRCTRSRFPSPPDRRHDGRAASGAKCRAGAPGRPRRRRHERSLRRPTERREAMADIWVLNANGSQATIFEARSPTAPLVEVATLENPEARAKQMDLASDRPGRTFDSVGGQRHAKEAPTEPKTQEQIRFAKAVADRLEHGRLENAFERLVLVAAPAFLGLLRPNLGAPLAARVARNGQGLHGARR